MVKPRDYAASWLFERTRQWQRDPDGYLDLWAREHYKSTIITFGGTISEFLNDPEETIGIFSHTRPIAKQFLRQIMKELENNELLKRIYPDVLYANPRKEAPKWSEDEGITVKRASNPKECTVEAHGLVDGQPVSKHFSTLMYDDVVTEKSVTTPDMVEKTTRAWELSTNLGKEGGRKRYTGTRYHMADSYHTMLDRGSVKRRIFAATNNGRSDGKPVMLSQEELDTKRRDQANTFAAQQLQNPSAGKEAMFDIRLQRTWLIRPRTLNVYILGDASKGRKATSGESRSSDRTAIAVIGVDADLNKYLLDGYRHRMNLQERWHALRNLYHRWSKTLGVLTCNVGWERYSMETDIEYFEERQQIEEISFSIEEVNWPREGPGSKEDRIGRLVPDVHSGDFMLPARVWHETHGPCCAWKVSEETNEFTYQPLKGMTRIEELALKRGIADCVAKPLRRLDEDKRVYDLTRAFLEEQLFYPYSLHDDLLDACSRVYDLEPAKPVKHDRKALEPTAYSDGV